MAKYIVTWKELRRAEIEADSQVEAMLKYEAGDYDSEFVKDEGLGITAEEDNA